MNKKTIAITNPGYLDKMSNFELSRWAALVEGVNLIAEKADDRGQKFDKMSIKQPALMKYIDSTCDTICYTFDHNDKVEEDNKKERESFKYE